MYAPGLGPAWVCLCLKQAARSSKHLLGHAVQLAGRAPGLVLLSLLWLPALASGQSHVSSRVTEITLFSDQALATRTARTAVTKGLNEVLFDVEAFVVDPDSVSARVFGDGEILSVQLKEVHLKESPQDKIRTIEEKLRELRDSRKAMLDSMDVLNKQDRFLGAIVDFAQTQLPQDIKTSFPKTEDLEKTLSFLGGNLEQLSRQRQAFDSKVKGVEEEIRVLEEELADLIEIHRPSKQAIEILFDAAKDQEITVEAAYLVKGAEWAPLYKAAVGSELGPLSLTMFSKIRQKTGEDWDGVSLSVSNVIPLSGAGLPSPSSWILDVPRPIPQASVERRMMLQEKGAAREPADEMEGLVDSAEKAPAEAGFAGAVKRALPLSFEYQMPRKLTVQSQDKETILPLFTKELEGRYFYYALPRLNPTAFLVCRATADKELLGGPVNVHFAGRFVGKTLVDEKKAGDTFDLNLGADREVRIKREKTADKVKETFFGKLERDTVVRSMAFKITAENLKDKPVAIAIVEAVPVSRTDRIKIADLKVAPEPSERDYRENEGVLLWEFELKPMGAKEITISFTLSYPKDEPIVGL